MAKIKTHLVQGKASYCKIIGEPRGGYPNGEGPLEWTFDLVLDEDGKADYLKSGGDKFYIKVNKTTGQEFLKFTRKAVKKDGTDGKPISILDHKGQPWDDRLIGNGSTLNVAYTLNPAGVGKTQRMKPSVLSVQVWDLVNYVPKGTFPTKQDAVVTDQEHEWDGN